MMSKPVQQLNSDAYISWFTGILRQGYAADLFVSGWSMFPFLLPGDVVRVTPLPPAGALPGQVVVYPREGKLVAHRLIKRDITTNTCTTRGDGNLKHDEPVKRDDICGVVTGIVSSRMPMAAMAVGKAGKILACVYPLSGWLFFHSGRVARATGLVGQCKEGQETR